MITDFSYSFGSDYTSNRVWWMVIAIMCTTVVGSSVLTAWPAVDAARVVAFFLLSSGFVTGITWTWANETHVGSAEECALTISSMNGLLYATGSFMPILIFPQTMAPKFERGFPSLVGFGVAACSLMLFTDFMHKRQLHLEAEQSDSAVPQSVVSLKRIRRTSTFGHKSWGSTFGTSIDAFEAFPRERPGFGRLECESYIYA
ncbi:hypothetical protein ACHAQC_004453 [Fusarium culmorum]